MDKINQIQHSAQQAKMTPPICGILLKNELDLNPKSAVSIPPMESGVCMVYLYSSSFKGRGADIG